MDQYQTPLPAAFVERSKNLLGDAEAEALFESLEKAPSVSIRHNPLKLIAPLEGESPVPWCEMGRYLSSRPRFTFDPLLHAGCYYVQEAASMFIEKAYRQIEFQPARMLDLCAAPGGKSTLWRSLLPEGALLIANEPIPNRAWILAENLAKWGHPDVMVTQAYPSDFTSLRGFFDVVAADVPCSGEGMFRKDEGARREWTIENVGTCQQRQWQIICDVWPTLRTGGYLIYSTCTFNLEENEENVARICKELGAETIEIPTDESWGICGDTTKSGLHVYHFFPHRAKGEGFFLALLRKTSEETPLRDKKNKREQRQTSVSGSGVVSQWLACQENFKIIRTDETHLAAVRQSLLEDFARIMKTVKILSAGILLAEEKGKKLIPQQSLALSVERKEEAFPVVELTYDEAIAYLRHETLTLSSDTPRGYAVVAYQGHALGFVNNLGARANNLYPAEWRIRN